VVVRIRRECARIDKWDGSGFRPVKVGGISADVPVVVEFAGLVPPQRVLDKSGDANFRQTEVGGIRHPSVQDISRRIVARALSFARNVGMKIDEASR